jgi:Zn-dependent peptidase ImmA (M78 family)
MIEPAVEKLCDRWRTKSPETAIIWAIGAAFPQLNAVQPPINLAELAKKRNVVSVKTRKLSVDGSISLLDDGGYVIELNENLSLSRRRFTFAHELGHTFFLDLTNEVEKRLRIRVEDVNVEDSKHSSKEEFLCNLAAAEILMPFDVFSGKASSLGPFATSILTLTRVFRTSLWSTSRRFVEASRVRMIVALWEYDGPSKAYRTRWVVRSSGIHEYDQLSIPDGAPLFKVFQSHREFRGRKWVSLGGPLDDYFVDGVVLTRARTDLVLTVFILDAAAERLAAESQDRPPDSGQLELEL